VSVVVPCYNYGHYLPQAVGSALDQHGIDVEVLIVDDASTDDSAEVALALAAQDPRVDVLLHEENRGHIRTYNDGLAKVTGDYVVLLSADDVLTPDSLTRAAALLERHPEVGLVYGVAETFRTDTPGSGSARIESWTVWHGDEWLRLVCGRARNLIVNPEVVMRRSLLEDLGGGYDVAHPHAGDMLLWMRAAARADIGRINGFVQAGYRVHGDNMHMTTYNGALTNMRHVGQVFDAFFDEHDSPQLRARARRALAREALLVGAEQQCLGRDAGDAGSFAVERNPAVVESRRWGSFVRRGTDGVGRAERVALLTAHRLRWKVRSQRSRRWGT
jgi:hypothetical protein